RYLFTSSICRVSFLSSWNDPIKIGLFNRCNKRRRSVSSISRGFVNGYYDGVIAGGRGKVTYNNWTNNRDCWWTCYWGRGRSSRNCKSDYGDCSGTKCYCIVFYSIV